MTYSGLPSLYHRSERRLLTGRCASLAWCRSAGTYPTGLVRRPGPGDAESASRLRVTPWRRRLPSAAHGVPNAVLAFKARADLGISAAFGRRYRWARPTRGRTPCGDRSAPNTVSAWQRCPLTRFAGAQRLPGPGCAP